MESLQSYIFQKYTCTFATTTLQVQFSVNRVWFLIANILVFLAMPTLKIAANINVFVQWFPWMPVIFLIKPIAINNQSSDPRIFAGAKKTKLINNAMWELL